jgi:hypothetical protein
MNNELHIHRISSALAQIIYDTLKSNDHTSQTNKMAKFTSATIP